MNWYLFWAYAVTFLCLFLEIAFLLKRSRETKK